MKTIIVLAAAAAMSGCAVIDKIADRKVDYEKCVRALVAGGVPQVDAERVCKKLSENADGVAALRNAL